MIPALQWFRAQNASGEALACTALAIFLRSTRIQCASRTRTALLVASVPAAIGRPRVCAQGTICDHDTRSGSSPWRFASAAQVPAVPFGGAKPCCVTCAAVQPRMPWRLRTFLQVVLEPGRAMNATARAVAHPHLPHKLPAISSDVLRLVSANHATKPATSQTCLPHNLPAISPIELNLGCVTLPPPSRRAP